MAGLSSILNAASSGIYAAQIQLDAVSNNITNVNTPGYVREVVNQEPNAVGDSGVTTGQITRTVNQFLEQANLTATAQSGTASTIAGFLDQAQSLFGDPSSSTGYFSQLDQFLSDVSSAVQNPTSLATRSQAVTALSGFLSQSSGISSQLQQLSTQAQTQIGTTVTQENSLLSQISKLNGVIIADLANKADASGAQNLQNGLVNQLSSLMSVTVSAGSGGGVSISTAQGAQLVNGIQASQLSYSTSGPTAGQIQVNSSSGGVQTLTPGDGTLAGLLQVANQQIPQIAEQLGEYVSQTVNQLNAAHNASTSMPPPNLLTGRNTGMDLTTDITGFTGKTNVAIVDSSGNMVSNVAIDFDAGTMSVDGGAAMSFTPSSFLSTLNSALGANGTASFSNGALSIQAANSTDGVAIADDSTTPSSKASQGFSQFFGLNNLVTSSAFTDFNTGITGTDANGFAAGGVVSLQIRNSSGALLRNVSVTMTGAGDMNALLAQLNSSTTGVGQYGAYSLDSNGALTFSPTQPGVSISVTGDTTQWGSGGASMSQLFGMDPSALALAPTSYSVSSAIASNPMNLAIGQLDPTATPGQTALTVGDTRGGQLLADVGSNVVSFNAAGAAGATQTTLDQYGAQLSGVVAQGASNAKSASGNAQAVASEASTRLASAEGVNLDQELINMTTYQQAYAASARLIQAVSSMFSALMNIQ